MIYRVNYVDKVIHSSNIAGICRTFLQHVWGFIFLERKYMNVPDVLLFVETDISGFSAYPTGCQGEQGALCFY